MLRFLLLVIIACFSGDCISAEIRVAPQGESKPALVSISGEILSGDGRKFFEQVEKIGHAIVFLQGPGGSLDAGLQIGVIIRKKGFVTVVAASNFCASACALAWLAGVRRYMEPTSRIGFHAAYVSRGGHLIEKGDANALIGAYLNELGLSISAIRYITSTAPDSLRWLTLEDAMLIGINVAIPSTMGNERPNVKSRTKFSTPASYENILSGVRHFNGEYKKYGIAGAIAEVAACYDQVDASPSLKKIEFCFALDYTANYIDHSFSKSFGVVQSESTSTAKITSRVNSALAKLGYGPDLRGQRIAEWSAMTIKAIGDAATR